MLPHTAVILTVPAKDDIECSLIGIDREYAGVLNQGTVIQNCSKSVYVLHQHIMDIDEVPLREKGKMELWTAHFWELPKEDKEDDDD